MIGKSTCPVCARELKEKRVRTKGGWVLALSCPSPICPMFGKAATE